MHRLPSKSTLWGFRIAALLVVGMYVSIPVTVGLMVYGHVRESRDAVALAGAVFGVGFCFLVASFAVTGRLRCPLCMVPSLASRRCSRNRNAKKLLGSYQLNVATSILLKDSFRCPYCGEPTVMAVREKVGGR